MQDVPPSTVPLGGKKAPLWRHNDFLANKNGPHSTIYWVKLQTKHEDGTYKGGKWKTSTRYIGDWNNNKKNGFGIQVFENGDKYEGGWHDGKMNGQGTLWVQDLKKNLRRRYTGDWKNGKRDGTGTMFYSNEDRYDGFWKGNLPCGEGRMIYKNGDVYVGQWYAGMRNGYGVLTKRNGDHFEGSWVQDKREGQGSYFFAEKNKLFVGEYVNDMPKCGISSEVVDDKDAQHQQHDQEKMPDFDDVPPIPQLGLKDPVGVLQGSLDAVKRDRLFYRAKYMTLHVLFQENELNELIEEFTAACGNERNELLLEEVFQMLPGIGIECEQDVLYEFYLKLLCETKEEIEEVRNDPELDLTLSFDLFARLIAIILEESNRLEEAF